MFALMGQIKCMLLINPYPVCVADKPVHVSFSELKLRLKVVTPRPLHFLSLSPLSVPLSIAVSASGLANSMIEYKSS